MLCWSLDQLLESEVKDLPITMMPDGWMEKTGGYAKDMTLRDYFAAKWMQAYVANPETADITETELAQFSYEIADAMLKAGQ